MNNTPMVEVVGGTMCTNAGCEHHPGEAEFRAQTLRPCDVIFGQDEQTSGLRYGVAVNIAAWQWEIVAVEATSKRHVAFVSTEYRLDQVLNLASGWASSLRAMSH